MIYQYHSKSSKVASLDKEEYTAATPTKTGEIVLFTSHMSHVKKVGTYSSVRFDRPAKVFANRGFKAELPLMSLQHRRTHE
jgi:hypothetical protein